MPELVLHTHNLAINNGDVERRLHDFNIAMLERQPDIIVAQEVSNDIGHAALTSLTSKLGPDYVMKFDAVYPGQEDEQGVAVISRLPIVRSWTTKPYVPKKQLQVAELALGDESIVITNTHLKSSYHELTRIKDSVEHAKAMDVEYPGVKRVMAGDFNAAPQYPVMQLLKKRIGYTSAFEELHGQEPEFTFPTFDPESLLDGKYVKPNELAFLKNMAKIINLKKCFTQDAPLEIPRYTIDYVLTKNMPPAVTAEVLQKLGADDQPISDHVGLTVSWSV